MRATSSDAGPDPGNEAIDAPFAVRFVHRLRFTRGALSADNPALADVIREGGRLPARVLGFVDDGLPGHGSEVLSRFEKYIASHDDVLSNAGPVRLVPGGEACKNDPLYAEEIVKAIDDAGLCRQSYVIVIGGGAVLDVVGFAASLAHRGVRVIRLPTTTLSQGDSGVGVKNGINTFGKKNFTGTFQVPWAVINDESLLETLEDVDWACGFAEAVKVALLKDGNLFDRIHESAEAIRARDLGAAIPVLRQSARLHLVHITEGGDPFESSTARPLDFGHWSAHKLEQITGFELRHGEAVALGLAIDSVYANLAGLLDRDSSERVLDCLERLGLVLYHEAMRDTERLLDGLEEFRQHLGGTLTVTLIDRIGRSRDVHEVDTDKVRAAIDHLAARSCAGGTRGDS